MPVTELAFLAAAAAVFFSTPLSSQEEEEPPRSRVAVRNPQIVAALPMGARRGSTVNLEIHGEFLDGASGVHFVEKDITARVLSTTFTRVRLETRVADGAEPGPRHFRLITPRGATNLLLFRVTDWPAHLESEPNDDLDNLSLLERPALVSGKLQTPRDVDLFRFHARAGERIGLHLLGYRNWSLSDLSLAVLDIRGRSVRQDEGTFIWDPYIDFICPKDGDYIAAVMLTRMPAGGQSGRDLVYQLAIGDAPLLISAFPLALKPGKATEVSIRGDWIGRDSSWRLEPGTIAPVASSGTAVSRSERAEVRLTATLPRDAGEEPLAIGIRHPSGIVSPLALLPAAAVRTESEPNDDLRSAEAITIPVTVNGRIQSRYDEDWFTFEAEAGECLTIEVDAEKAGSRLDARVVILDAQGKTVQAGDDAKGEGGLLNWDPRLEHTFKERGKYYLRIYNLQRRGGEDWVYALTVRRPAPDFSLRLANERLALPRGDRADWTVHVNRRDGYEGPVTIEISGLPAGVAAPPVVVPGDKSSGKLSLTASADAKMDATEVCVIGKALVGGNERSRKAIVPASRAQGSGPGYSSYVATAAWLSVTEPTLFSLESAASEVFVVRDGTAEFGIKISRRAGFDGKLEFSLENSPPGVEIRGVEIIDQGKIARLKLGAAVNAKVGRTPDVTVIGTFVRGHERRSESAPRISVQVD